MFGKLGEAKQKAEEIRQKLDAITMEGEAGNGKVKVIVTGNRRIKDVLIAEEMMTPDRREELQDLVAMAAGNALERAENVSQSEMQALMSTMLPGGLGNLLK